MEIRKPDGNHILLDVHATPIFDKAGAVEFAMATFSDISERKRFEMQLRQSEARLRQLMEALPVGIFVVDAKAARTTTTQPPSACLAGGSLRPTGSPRFQKRNSQSRVKSLCASC
jgi:PAS domain-containing protein